jgi:hypothetical protein
MAAAGYTITRIPDESRLLAAERHPTSGMLFEFMGPSGVGKTSLYRDVQAVRSANWLPVGDVLGLSPREISEAEELQTLLSDLILDRVEEERRRSVHAWTVAGAAEFASRAAKTYIVLRRHYARGIMLDEGILHAFSAQLARTAERELRTLLDRHVIVFLDARHPETVAQRFIERDEARKAAGHFVRPISLDQAAATAQATLDVQRALYHAALECGRSCIRIYAEDGPDRNRRDVLEFEARVIADLACHGAVADRAVGSAVVL